MLSATDIEVCAVPAADAVAVMERAVLAHGAGDLSAPVRQNLDVEGGFYIFTAGRLPGVANGFRVGNAIGETAGEATLVFSPDGFGGRGEPVGVVTGRDLGRRRTGALGGVAARLCSREDSHTAGFIGAGQQAFTQLWAISAVRDLHRVRVFSRNTDTANAFALRAREDLDLAVDVVPTAHDAVLAADILVMSTPSAESLIDLDWIVPGTHIHTLGPKGRTLDPSGAPEGECPRVLVKAADLFFSDSPDQLLSMEGDDRPWSQGRPALAMGDIATGRVVGRQSVDDITLYASVGLAGTEVLFADHVLRST